MQSNQIIIEPCSNGYVVILPEQYQPIPMNQMYHTMVAAGKAIRGDDEITKLKGEQSFEDNIEKVTIAKANNVFVFTTFKEVLDFLRYKISE